MKKAKLCALATALLIAASAIFSTSVLAQPVAPKKPKNIIFFISDGWGYYQIDATNYFMHGNANAQAYEAFQQKYGMSTYPAKTKDAADLGWYHGGYNSDSAWSSFNFVKGGATGSAPAATSMASGKKSYYKAIGVDIHHNPLVNITERAEELGKAAGVVSSVQWTHATPAAFVAHNVHRDNYDQLGREMLLDSKLEVIMGAGHPWFNTNGDSLSSAASYKYVGGQDAWTNLNGNATTYGVPSNSGNYTVQDVDGDGTPDPWTLVQTRADFQALMSGNTPKRVVGTAQVAYTLQEQRDGVADTGAFIEPFIQSVPTLEEMTKGAINVLDNDADGFFLMVEGGAIDWAGHANEPGRMIEEQADFNDAVQAAIDWVNANGGWDETMIIVTGDHECGYLTGPNYNDNNPITNPIVNNGVGSMPGMKWNSGGHTNQIIPFFAQGAGSSLFSMYADEYDYYRGAYINNTEIGQVMLNLWPEPNYIMPNPENIIVMISDGWGENQILASEYFSGQTPVYKNFPSQYYMSTYPAKTKDDPQLKYYSTGYYSDLAWSDFDYINHGATGSAPAASSMAAGKKSYYKGIGVDIFHNPIFNITEMAENMGKASGVVSSVEWTHATPAAFVAHNIHRDNYDQLGREMLLDSKLEVIMGAGHPEYDNSGNMLTSGQDYKYVGGYDAWNKLNSGSTIYTIPSNSGNNTVQDIDYDGVPDAWTLITGKNDFANLMTGPTPKRVVGVAEVYQTLQQSRGGNGDTVAYGVPFVAGVPSLETMTKGALNVLDNDQDGFFLMVEGGAVDWSGHANQMGRCIEEQDDFNASVQAVVDWVENNSSWDKTLVIVTGDHETGYLTGPDTSDNSPITNPVGDNGVGNMPSYRWNSGSHTNQLIPFFAKGAGADFFEMFADEYDYHRDKFLNNTEIAQAMMMMWKGTNTATNNSPKVNLANMKACVGDTICVPVNMHNLANIGAIQLAVTFDNMVLDFVGIANQSPQLSGLISHENGGSLGVSWTSNGYYGADFFGSKLMDLEFVYLGGYSNLMFGTTCEVSDNTTAQPVAVLFENGSVSTNSSILGGHVSYHNMMNTALTASQVCIMDGMTNLSSSTTDANGNYVINDCISGGDYKLTANTTKNHGGLSATDALLVARYFVGLNGLDEMQMKAADVTGDNAINAIDGLEILKRSVGVIDTFMVSDWMFEMKDISVNGMNQFNNLKGICAGDVNMSYVPSLAKSSSYFAMTTNGKINAQNGDVVRIPVSIDRNLNMGAITVDIMFDPSAVEIMDIHFAGTDETLVWTLAENTIQLSWYSVAGLSLVENDVVFEIEARINDIAKAQLLINERSELANIFAHASDAKLSIPALIGEGQYAFELNSNYPNPFTQSTQISYSIPEQLEVQLTVYNSLMEEVVILVNSTQSAGEYNVDFSAKNLPAGVYYYSLKASNGENEYSSTRKMIIQK